MVLALHRARWLLRFIGRSTYCRAMDGDPEMVLESKVKGALGWSSTFGFAIF
jgi:hypothetical protein